MVKNTKKKRAKNKAKFVVLAIFEDKKSCSNTQKNYFSVQKWVPEPIRKNKFHQSISISPNEISFIPSFCLRLPKIPYPLSIPKLAP